MIARPARVRMRARNPCLRARRRVLGWKVRFTMFSRWGRRAVLRAGLIRGRGARGRNHGAREHTKATAPVPMPTTREGTGRTPLTVYYPG